MQRASSRLLIAVATVAVTGCMSAASALSLDAAIRAAAAHSAVIRVSDDDGTYRRHYRRGRVVNAPYTRRQRRPVVVDAYPRPRLARPRARHRACNQPLHPALTPPSRGDRGGTLRAHLQRALARRLDVALTRQRAATPPLTAVQSCRRS
jgi:hypothetical protein